jgi:predicted site-specific integrase-resolvase
MVASVGRLLTFDEFLAETGLRPTTARKLVKSGALPVVVLPGVRRTFVARTTVERLLAGELFTPDGDGNDARQE